MFEKINSNLVTAAEVPTTDVNVRAVVRTIAHGQGHFHCSCKTKCNTKRCKCLKGGYKCNSRCHSSLSCDNK